MISGITASMNREMKLRGSIFLDRPKILNRAFEKRWSLMMRLDARLQRVPSSALITAASLEVLLQ
uniref:Uncharacterized protein n=1 Tax=Salix viminalis TaxID=40686 RepID=A0A6N2K1S3_SALVM